MRLTHKISKTSAKSGGVAAALLCFMASFGATGQELGFDGLRDNLEYQLELIAKRQLSDAELDRATEEFHALFDNYCDQRCIETIEINNNRVKPMETDPGTSADLYARQWYSQVLYFSPTQGGSFIQSLTNEVDPIRIYDNQTQRIMTIKDVAGHMNIRHFLDHGGEPIDQSYSEWEIEAEAVRYLETIPTVSHRASLSAELWAGISQNWHELDAGQKDAVLAYLQDTEYTARLDVSTYQVLLNMPPDQALEYLKNDQHQQNMARLAAISEMMLMGQVAVYEARSYSNWGSGWW